MTPDALRAAIASARERPRMYGDSPGDLETYLHGLVAGAYDGDCDVRGVWAALRDPPLRPGVHPDSTFDSVCDHALRVVAALWPQGEAAARRAPGTRRCPACGGEWRDNPTETCPECAVRFESVEAPAPPLDLDAIEARYARTTGGPWAYEHCGEGLYCVGLTEPPAVGLVEDVYDEERGEYVEKPDVVEFVAEFHGDDAVDNARFTAAARTDVPALVAEVRRLRAVIEGREAPTIEEAQMHIDAGGSFRVVSANGGSYSAGSVFAVDLAVEDFPGCRWWAIDANGRPCPWPEVTP